MNWTLNLAALRMLYRNPHTVVWTLALPVIVLIALGLIGIRPTQQARIGLAGGADRPFAARVVRLLDSSGAVALTRGSASMLRSQLRAGKLDLVAELAADGSVTTYYDSSRGGGERLAETALTAALDRARGVDTPRAAVPIEAQHLGWIDFLAPGVVALAIMNGSLFTVLYGLVHLKRRGVLRRLMATPMRPLSFLGAYAGARLSLALLQAAVIFVVAAVLGERWHGDPLWALPLAALGAAVFVALGYGVAGFVGNVETAAPVANAIGLPMLLVSGALFPREILPAWLAVPAGYLPLSFLADGLRAAAEGAPAGGILLDMAGLAAWLAACAAASVRFFHWRLE
ncbi:MAG: ABC transporter permease [Candidatus Dormibacteraceae bacterium]